MDGSVSVPQQHRSRHFQLLVREGVVFMLFFSFFKTFVGKTVTVELKNDVVIRGKVHSVDQYLNIKLEDIEILNVESCPQLVGFFCFGF